MDSSSDPMMISNPF